MVESITIPSRAKGGFHRRGKKVKPQIGPLQNRNPPTPPRHHWMRRADGTAREQGSPCSGYLSQDRNWNFVLPFRQGMGCWVLVDDVPNGKCGSGNRGNRGGYGKERGGDTTQTRSGTWTVQTKMEGTSVLRFLREVIYHILFVGKHHACPRVEGERWTVSNH